MTGAAVESVDMKCEAESRRQNAGRPGRDGFSMTEMVIAISVIGVLAGIVIPGLTSTLSGSKETMAIEKLETLNQALNAYGHAYKEYTYTPNNSSGTDELTVLLDLQYRNPNEAKALTGSPFVRTNYRPGTSSDSSDYRIVWTGMRFKLLRPGDTGTGIKVVFDGSDTGTPFAYPPNYSSSGR